MPFQHVNAISVRSIGPRSFSMPFQHVNAISVRSIGPRFLFNAVSARQCHFKSAASDRVLVQCRFSRQRRAV
jgi:hypothetical protein